MDKYHSRRMDTIQYVNKSQTRKNKNYKNKDQNCDTTTASKQQQNYYKSNKQLQQKQQQNYNKSNKKLPKKRQQQQQ